MISPGDKDLATFYPEMITVTEGHCSGSCQVGACAGFSKAHGSSPLATEHLGHKPLFQFIRGKAFNQMSCPVCQAWGHIKGLACPIHQIVYDDPHHMRETLATIFRVTGCGNPSVFAVYLERLSEFRGTADLPLFKNNAPLLPNFLKRFYFGLSEFYGFGHKHIEGLPIKLPIPIKFAQAAIIQLLFQDKKDVLFI